MIYQFIDNLFEAAHIIRHFFRAFICKSYFVESHGVSMCDRTQGCCEWYWCPKRKGGEDR